MLSKPNINVVMESFAMSTAIPFYMVNSKKFISAFITANTFSTIVFKHFLSELAMIFFIMQQLALFLLWRPILHPFLLRCAMALQTPRRITVRSLIATLKQINPFCFFTKATIFLLIFACHTNIITELWYFVKVADWYEPRPQGR